MMLETSWRFYREGAWHRIEADYGIDYSFARQNTQTPYFTITGTIERRAKNNRWVHDVSGAIHDEIAEHLPKLAPYVKWHMVGPDGPMHYIENSKYWLEMAQGKVPLAEHLRESPLDLFKRTIKLGAFPGDVIPDLRGPKEWSPQGLQSDLLHAPWSAVHAWLARRLPSLLAAWVVDMGELGVLE
jgi:hypothetical protein